MADPVTPITTPTPTTAAQRLAESGWSSVSQRQQGLFELQCLVAECKATETITAELPERFPRHRCRGIGHRMGVQTTTTPTDPQPEHGGG